MSDSVYLGSKEAAERLQMTARRVIGLCSEGKIEGAFREGRNWKIPEDSVQAMAAELKARKKCGKEKSQKLLPCAVGNTSYMEIARDCIFREAKQDTEAHKGNTHYSHKLQHPLQIFKFIT